MAERIAAAGAGRMGRGLAIVFAYAGHPVSLIDLKERDDPAGVRFKADLTFQRLQSRLEAQWRQLHVHETHRREFENRRGP